MLILDNLSGDHWPQGHSAYLHASFLEKDKGEKGEIFSYARKGETRETPTQRASMEDSTKE